MGRRAQETGRPAGGAETLTALPGRAPWCLVPQLAQPAIQGGRHAAAQIRRLLAGEPTEAMAYRNKGTMATIGRSAAVAHLPLGVRLTGRVAWAGWLGLHIAMLMGHRNRPAGLANLSVRYLAWPGRLNVIVGDPP